MTAVQSAYTLSSDLGGKAWLHACPFDTNFERRSVACNRSDSAEYNRFFQVFSSLSSDVFERKIETCPYVVKLKVTQDTNWEDHTVPSGTERQTINQRLASPQKPRLFLGGGISAHAAAYNLPRDFGKSAEAIMKAYEDEPEQEDSR